MRNLVKFHGLCVQHATMVQQWLFLVFTPPLASHHVLRTAVGVALQLVQDRVFTELEHQVQLPLPPEHLQQVHQVWVLQALQHKTVGFRLVVL